jgi:hypothetical protein
MSCFSLSWIEQVLIWLVILAAVVALLRLVLPAVFSMLGVEGGLFVQAVNIVIWAIVVIAAIYFVFALISCLVGSGGFPLPHR